MKSLIRKLKNKFNKVIELPPGTKETYTPSPIFPNKEIMEDAMRRI